MEFFERSDVVPTRTQRIPQNIETPVAFVPVPNAYVRFAYSRSSDSMASQIEGQDYLCFQHNEQRFVFVVCDGVGSSFSGNLAARILGDNLLEWLWLQEIPRMGSDSALDEAAAGYLNRLQKQAQIEVEEHDIPDHITGLIRQALESQREYGSEAIFAACRIDYPSPMIPDGLLSVIWMGDTRIRVFEGEDEVDMGGSWANANRWSTVKGVKGSMNAWMQPLRSVTRVVSFSDGLNAHFEEVLAYSDTTLDREIRADSKLPTSDDVSFIDVVLRSAIYEGYPDPDLPDPNLPRPHLEQIWNPSGTGTYEVRWRWPEEQKASFLIQEARSPVLTDSTIYEVPQEQTMWKPSDEREPGVYYYRVRAVTRRGTVTPWSELRRTKVAFPPPPAPDLTVGGTDSAPVLMWTEEGDTLDYIIERAEVADFSDVEVVFEGRSTEWIIPVNQITPGTYYYRVKALSDGGESPFSTVEEVTITPPPPPRPQPGAINYDKARGIYLLRWQPCMGATFYEVEEAPDEGEVRIINTGEDTLCEIDLEEMAIGGYDYRVRACHDWACSDWSSAQSIIIAPPPPEEAPELSFEGPDDQGQITVRWSELDEADEYLLEISEEADFRNARMVRQSEREHQLLRREPGSLYLRVCGRNTGGNGPWSEIDALVIEPDAPAWLEADLDGRNVRLTWGAVGGRISYRLEVLRGEVKNRTHETVYEGEDTHAAYQIDAVEMQHTFRVRTEAGDSSSRWQYSDVVQAVVGPPPPQMIGAPRHDPQSGQVTLRWEAVDKATHYQFEVSTSEDFGQVLQVVPVQETQTTFNPSGTGSYWFRVRSCQGDACGEPSDAVNLRIDQPGAPRLWAIDPVDAGETFELTWVGVPGCDFYICEESTSRQFERETTKLVKVLHPSQKIAFPIHEAGVYYFRVKAIKEEGKPGVWSNVLRVEVVES